MDNKVLVLYKSKYGSTKRYAGWIAESTAAEIFELSCFDIKKLDDYKVILFGSSVHTGKIKQIEFIIRNWSILKEKKLAVFSVTGAPSDDPIHHKIGETNLPPEIRREIGYYPLQGAYDYHRLDLFDKFLMNGLRMFTLLKWSFAKNKSDKDFLDNFYIPQDWTDKKAIEPIVTFVKCS